MCSSGTPTSGFCAASCVWQCLGSGGGTDATCASSVADTSPVQFSFDPVIDAPLSSLITSNTVTITDINTAAPISVSGGTYSIGCTATFTSVAGTIGNNQTVCVRHTSSAANSTAVTTTLTVGGVSSAFVSTTITAQAACTAIPIVLNSNITGTLASDCASIHRTGRYASYYTFTLSTPTTVTISMSGGLDTYLYLLAGNGSAGAVLASDDDSLNDGTYGSKIVVNNLAAGMYTIEATTYNSSVSGSFSLLVQAQPIIGTGACSLDVSGSGTPQATPDGLMVLRYLLGIRGSALTQGLSITGPRNGVEDIEAFLAGYDYGVTGTLGRPATIDGLILLRLLQGVPDSALLSGINVPAGAAFRDAAAIRANVNARCGTAF